MQIMIFCEPGSHLTIHYKVVAILYLFFIAEIILHLIYVVTIILHVAGYNLLSRHYNIGIMNVILLFPDFLMPAQSIDSDHVMKSS